MFALPIQCNIDVIRSERRYTSTLLILWNIYPDTMRKSQKSPYRIKILTACTGRKRFSPAESLTYADFMLPSDEFSVKEGRLPEYQLPARDMYTGEQHIRLLEGIEYYTEQYGTDSLDLSIVSAGYGLIGQDRFIVPYESTFQGLNVAEIDERADQLNIPNAARQFLRQPCDLCIVALGESYLRALKLDDETEFAAPTLIFTGAAAVKYVPNKERVAIIVLSNADAQRFRCGLVGLKGELTKRVLHGLVNQGQSFFDALFARDADVLSLLYKTVPRLRAKPPVKMPDDWLNKRHRNKLRFFLPDWDDLVDPNYDFDRDLTSTPLVNWAHQSYAHELYGTLNADGVLVSRAVTDKPRSKAEGLRQLGVHDYLRLPPEVPILGDCGAFSYISQDVPPYSIEDVLSYYTHHKFDFGVSPDHLIFGGKTDEDRKRRYELTINNAEEFLAAFRTQSLPWHPIGAIQGETPEQYARAAEQLVKMGYTYIGLGGLVRSKTRDILAIAERVQERIRGEARLHLFGVARPHGLEHFTQLGIASVDTASYLRSAWTRNDYNYLMPDDVYTAIRIPDATRTIKKAIKAGTLTVAPETLHTLERAALDAMSDYAARRISVDTCFNVVAEYDQHFGLNRENLVKTYRHTLEDRPWEQCGCAICRKDGIQVAIFRGNNRNRRRGFHNSYVYYRIFQSVLAGEPAPVAWPSERVGPFQRSLPLELV